ncbi:MAG: hypothetical protein ACTSWR_12295 [Candidatus Helarchaeota archaeon]
MPKKNKEKRYVVIQIHDMNKITTTKRNEIKEGIIRVKGLLKKDEHWVTQSYEIPLNNFGVFDSDIKKRLMEMFMYPNLIANSETSRFIKKLVDEYGDILPLKPKNLLFKTTRYKKKFKIKQRRLK